MIIDLSVSNFRSFQEEQLLSMSVEGARNRHSSNYSLIEDGRFAILRSAAIFGANASGKSNLLMAAAAIRWIVLSSGGRKDGQTIPPYEPFKLSRNGENEPVSFEIEFVVPSGIRYRYEVSFSKDRVLEERLYSFARRSKAVIFERGAEDTWETIKFGGTYRGGNRKFPFFSNAAYLSRAGNDASAPEFIREIYRYFNDLYHIPAGRNFFSLLPLADTSMLSAVSELVCLADTGVSMVTIEENEGAEDIKLPENMPLDLKEAILAQNKMSAKYWVKTQADDLVAFDEDDMSDGTTRLLHVLPLVVNSLDKGSVLFFDEIDAHFHTDLVHLILRLFHDSEINHRGAQIIFSTHDTNILDSANLRRDQIWFVSKDLGASSLKSLDEYDKKYVRHDSPFEAFYRDGRLGALPRVSFARIKDAILGAMKKNDPLTNGMIDA